MYAYCENNQINFADQNGDFGTPISWALALIAGVAGAWFGNSLADKLKLKGYARWAFIGAIAVGGAAIGFFVGEAIVAYVGGILLANPALMMKLPSSLLWLFGLGGPKIAVIGSTNFGVGYVNLAKHLGAAYFWLQNYFSLSPAARWELNQAFLDRCISKGMDFILSNNAYVTLKDFPDSQFAKEILYLLEQGYRIIDNGFRMIK